MDFMGDQLADGRTIQVFNVIDDFTRRSGASRGGVSTIRVLDRLVAATGFLQRIVMGQ